MSTSELHRIFLSKLRGPKPKLAIRLCVSNQTVAHWDEVVSLVGFFKHEWDRQVVNGIAFEDGSEVLINELECPAARIVSNFDVNHHIVLRSSPTCNARAIGKLLSNSGLVRRVWGWSRNPSRNREVTREDFYRTQRHKGTKPQRKAA